MQDITTKSGFKCKINDNLGDDLEFLQTYSNLMKADDQDAVFLIEDVLRSIFMDEKVVKKFKDHIKKQKGYLSITEIQAEINEIFENDDSTKN